MTRTDEKGAQRRLPKLGLAFWVSAAWLIALIGVALLAPVLPLADPEALGIRTGERVAFERPGWNSWFGADGQGRDLFANMVFAARPTLLLAAIVTILAAVFGALLGIVAAVRRGATEAVLMAASDMVLAFPMLILIASLTGTLGRTLWVLVLGFTIVYAPAYARIIRANALSIVERDFVLAARAQGAGWRRIVVREIGPNLALPVLAFACLGFGFVIGAEGGLAFVGLSVEENTWGTFISRGIAQVQDVPHLALVPSTVLLLTINSLNLIGDRLREEADPMPARKLASSRAPGARRDPSRGSAPPGLLRVDQLTTELQTEEGPVRTVDHVSFSLRAGRTLGIVGESGSGKTMILRSILGTFPLAQVDRSGSVEFDGTDLLDAPLRDRRRILGTDIGVVTQNPLTTLSPVRSIGSQLVETMTAHGTFSKSEASERARDLLERVGIPEPERRLRQYPHELSGGMLQRVTIALALVNEPRLLLADEPTTALDVTIQHQILRLLAQLQAEHELAIVLVSHNLAVIRGFTDEIAVVYAGQIVETGPTDVVLADPRMRYTEALLASTPRLDDTSTDELPVIEGQPPQLTAVPDGCRFAPRCGDASDICHREQPPHVREDDERSYACWHPAGTDVRVEVSNGR